MNDLYSVVPGQPCPSCESGRVEETAAALICMKCFSMEFKRGSDRRKGLFSGVSKVLNEISELAREAVREPLDWQDIRPGIGLTKDSEIKVDLEAFSS